MIRYTDEARESTINHIYELIQKIGSVSGDQLNYTDATAVIHYLAEFKDLIEKEHKNKKPAYRDYIQQKRAYWIGQKVVYDGTIYTVLGVDYNGALLIDKPAQFTDTTAVDELMVERAR